MRERKKVKSHLIAASYFRMSISKLQRCSYQEVTITFENVKNQIIKKKPLGNVYTTSTMHEMSSKNSNISVMKQNKINYKMTQ